jgi:phospholipid-translocating ATPase
VYTLAPVFSLVLDEDVPERLVFVYPELYRELQKGRVLSMKTFFVWISKSIYQGGAIMIAAMILFEDSLVNIVSITFTALVLAELLNVGFEVCVPRECSVRGGRASDGGRAVQIHKWHWMMVAAELSALALYLISMFVLRAYFGVSRMALSWGSL